MTEKNQISLNCLAIKLTTTVGSSPEEKILGSGTLYLNANDQYDYVLTALHCILGTRSFSNGTNTYRHQILQIKTIELLNNSSLEDGGHVSQENLSDLTNSVLVFPDHDAAVIKIPKSFGQKIGNVPKIALHSRPRKGGTFLARGYPARSSTVSVTLKDIEFVSADGQGIFEAKTESISGESAQEALKGYSGTGVFWESKPILIGFIAKVAEDFAIGGILHVRDYSFIDVNDVLKSKNLEKITLIDNVNKVIIDSETDELMNATVFVVNGIPLNIWKAVENTKSDIKDDWFPDPLRYKDLLRTDFICQSIMDTVKLQGGFKPGSSAHYFIPKEGFTTRNAIQTPLVDRIVLQASVEVIAEAIDSNLSNKVYSYRYNDSDSNDEYFFIPHIEQWKKLLYQIKQDVLANNQVLVIIDISNYFDNIPIDKLASFLRKQIEKKALPNMASQILAVQLVQSILERWKSHNAVKAGIPQNREACSFLANMYLASVDHAMATRGYNYYRYMDDIRIVCDDHFHARKAIMDLTEQLAEFGLTINSSKTHIIEQIPESPNEELKRHFPQDIKVMEQIDSLIATRRAREIQMAVPMTISLLRDTIANEAKDKRLDFRHFSFCITRLQLFAQVPSLRVLVDFDEIVQALVPRFVSHPWLTDVYGRFLMAIDSSYLKDELLNVMCVLLTEEKKNVYSWQAYHIWKLLAFHRIVKPELQTQAFKIIDGFAIKRAAEIGGAAIYLASTDLSKYADELVKCFNSRVISLQDEFLKRCFVIALRTVSTQDLNFNGDSRLQKMHFDLNAAEGSSTTNTEYVSPLPSLRLNEVFRNLPDQVST